MLVLKVLVSTKWVQNHIKHPKVKILEVDYDPKANYELDHIYGAVLLDWKKDLNDPVSRDLASRKHFEELLQRSGVNNNTTVILYGDFNNWFELLHFGCSSITGLTTFG